MKEKDSLRLKIIGKKLQDLRLAKGLTQEQLSYLCDVDRAKISKIESGSANFYITTLIELSVGLGVSPGELINSLTIKLPTDS